MSALEQAYASADVNKIPIQTIELLHPTFVDLASDEDTIRYVSSQNITKPVLCRLEDSAPVDAGKIVQFDPAPIAIKRPEKSNKGYADLSITIGVTSLEIEQALDAVSEHSDPLRCYYRVYVLNPETGEIDGPQNQPFEWTLYGSTTKRGELSATASLADIVNRPFPYFLYTPSFAPGLVRT